MGDTKKPNDPATAQKMGWMTATAAAKYLRVKPAAIKAVLQPDAYFYLGVCGRRTAFYNVSPYRACVEGKSEAQRWVLDNLEKIKNYRSPAKVVRYFFAQMLEYREYPNLESNSYRTVRLPNVAVEQDGDMLTIYKQGRESFRKRIDAHGLKLVIEPGSEMPAEAFAAWLKDNGLKPHRLSKLAH